MSLPTIPALLSAILFAGSAGAAATTFKPDRTEAGRSARAGKPDAKHAKARGLCAIVDCTPEQKAEIAEIRAELREDRKDDREARAKVNAELAREFRKDDPSHATLQRVFSEMDTMRATRAKAQLESLEKIHGVLTPEQRDALADRMEKRGAHAVHAGGHDHGKRKDGSRKGKAKGKAKAKRKAKSDAPDKDKGKDKAKAKAKRDAARR